MKNISSHNLCLAVILAIFVWLGFSSSAVAQLSPKRYIVHGVLNLETAMNHGFGAMDKMVKAGCNAVALTVMWDRIYPKPNSTPNWAQIDNQINHVINDLGVKLIIRIHLGRHIASTTGFWAPEESVVDFRGKPLTYYYDNNHFSFAHQPSIEKAAGFVKEVCERYKDLQKRGHILFMSVVNTPQQEMGYAYENQQYPSPSYVAIFDHSKWSMIKWKDWAKTKYQTIRTLNSYWGTTYKTFPDVEPYVNWFAPKDSFRGLRGKDWYYFRHISLKGYVDRMAEAVKSVDSTYKIACEFGGVADNLSLLRGTFGFKNLSEKYDIVKTSIDAFQGEELQADLVVSNLAPKQKFYTEIAHFDQATAESLRDYVDRSIDYGCEVIMLYVDYDNGKDVEKILPAVKEGVAWINRDSPPIVFADSVKYRLSQLIDDREGIVRDWKDKSNNGKRKIRIIYDEDIIHEKQVIDNPLPDLPDPEPNPDPGSGPVIQPDPPKPPLQDGPNLIPIVTYEGYTQQIVINQPFVFRIPENLFVDPDGYIAYIEMMEAPNWLHFNKFEFSFYGRPPVLGKVKIKLKIYDNKGGSLDSYLYIESIPPAINFELIKADYFDVPIEGWGAMSNNRVLYLEALPEKLNILASCNLDSVNFHFDLSGPYKFKNVSERLPFNLFGEGRGLKFPVGTYTLTAGAYKKDTLITAKTIQFTVVSSTDSTKNTIANWQAYPNPFERVCNVKLPVEESGNDLSFSIYTSAGKKIAIRKENIQIKQHVAYIDLSNMGFPAGNYLLEISKNGQPLKLLRISKI